MELSWILQSITALAVGAIAYFLKGTMADIKEGIKKNDKEIESLRNDLNDLKSDLPFVYVLREDFIRTLNNVDSKMGNIDSKIDKVLLQFKGRARGNDDG
jgi:septation ring formation regulator EzrA